MRFAEWLIFEDIKEDFNKCAINLVEINANSLLKQALETKGFIEENTDSIVLSEVWDSSETHLSENLENCNCSSLMSKSRVPVDCCSLKCLKDLMIQVRLGAIQQRKKDILNLAKLNDKLMQAELEIQEDPEDIFLKDDLEDVAKEQLNLIKKLGYAKKAFVDEFYPDDGASIEGLKKRTAMAMKEKNEVPEEMEIYLNPSATNDFGNLLTKMFITDEKTMERASDIFLHFVKRLTKKNKKGEWQNFAGLKGTLEDLEDTACDDSGGTVQGSKRGPTLNKLSQFMKAQIYGIKKNPEDLGIKTPQKDMLGKGFSRNSKMDIVSHDLGYPFGRKENRTKENLTFYKDALKALQDGNPDLIDTLASGRTTIPGGSSSATVARHRKEIIEDIYYGKSQDQINFPISPPNDENIRKSLENYYKYMKGSSIRYAVNIGQDKGDEETSKKGIEGMSGGGSDVLQQLTDKEDLGILNKMKAQLRKMLLSKNEKEMHQALAFCIKYGLNCNNFEKIKIDKDVIKVDDKGKMEAKPGLPLQAIANGLSKTLNQEVDYQKARTLVMGAEEKMQSLY